MKIRAAVAWEPQKPLAIEEIDIDGPREGEVLLKVVATGVCHTDAFTLSGDDPEGAFPCVLGHEGGCEVVECGPGVKNLKPGDHVIPLYIPECGDCEYCRSPKTNLCQSIAATVWTGYMPDGTRRFSKNGNPIYHYMAAPRSRSTPLCRRSRLPRSIPPRRWTRSVCWAAALPPVSAQFSIRRRWNQAPA